MSIKVYPKGEIEKFDYSKIILPYWQYSHMSFCKTGPCRLPRREGKDNDLCCEPFIHRIHEPKDIHRLPKHKNCDCYYKEIKTLSFGSISKKGAQSPDVWLKLFGKLPDYYITKREAEDIYGWRHNKNKLSNKAPGKMIGGDAYHNMEHILPEKDGRVWYHCDVDYESGDRNNLRLYYSNDGLMFYSPTHLDGDVIVYQIKGSEK